MVLALPRKFRVLSLFLTLYFLWVVSLISHGVAALIPLNDLEIFLAGVMARG